MDILSAIRSVRLNAKKEGLKNLTTYWGEHLNTDSVLQEYPRPQMKRTLPDSYINLNGYWDYSIYKKNAPAKPDGKILVPFSPEATLSGVHRQLQPDETLKYQRTLNISLASRQNQCCILHFGAVDQEAALYVNDTFICAHTGGYLPFSADITSHIHEGENTITVYVKDVSDTSYHAIGKQKLKRGGMFYTAQSGIWQTVWMEWVPETYITNVKITPNYDKETIHVCLKTNKPLSNSYHEESVFCHVLDHNNHVVSKGIFTNQPDSLCTYSCYCDIDNVISWTPENPYLYNLKVQAGEDEVLAYFAMRCFSIEKDNKGVPRFCLNHSPIYLKGVLDQGYWPDGLYTAPSDEAFVYDIQKMKSLGFNMLRKHAKIEAARWYYHCDRLGMIVWQDMVNGGGYSAPIMTWLPTISTKIKTKFNDKLYPLLCRGKKAGRKEFTQECVDTIQHLRAFPCISTWVIFNEGWGQFDTEMITKLVRVTDPERTINSASGWFDMGCGDYKSEHNYFRKQFVIKDPKRAFVISEFGGYAHPVKGHTSTEKVYGYKQYKKLSDFQKAYQRLMNEEVYLLIPQGLCATVYTQVSDIEEETNGILTYDRKICKL